MIEVGDSYRYKDHVGTIDTIERQLDENNEWHMFLVVHLPTMPKGEQWLTTHGPESDFSTELLQ